jgi:hypothetical protein
MEVKMSRKANVKDNIRFQTKPGNAKRDAILMTADIRREGCDIDHGIVIEETTGYPWIYL